MGSEREHRRAHERAQGARGETNTTTKRHISPLPNGRYSLFTFNRRNDETYTFVRTGVRKKEAEEWLNGEHERVDAAQTQADRIMQSGRTQALTPVELSFFGVPDHMVKPSDGDRVPLRVDPTVRDRLNRALSHDDRFRAIGYSEFLARTLDALGCE